MSSNQNEKLDCDSLYTDLNRLKALLKQYTKEYRRACANEEKTDVFLTCRKMKSIIQKKMYCLQEKVISERTVLKRINALPDDKNNNYKDRLKEMIKHLGAKEAVSAAKELDSNCQCPSKKEILKKIAGLSVEQLAEIGKGMKVPTVIIVPDKSFFELAKAVDDASYPSRRESIHIDRKIKDEPTSGNVKVCIMDMVAELDLVFGQFDIANRSDSTRDLLEEAMFIHDFRLPEPREYITALYQTLRTGDYGKIIDFKNKNDGDAFTLIDSKPSQEERQIIGGLYLLNMGKPAFLYYSDNSKTSALRARPVFDLIK